MIAELIHQIVRLCAARHAITSGEMRLAVTAGTLDDLDRTLGTHLEAVTQALSNDPAAGQEILGAGDRVAATLYVLLRNLALGDDRHASATLRQVTTDGGTPEDLSRAVVIVARYTGNPALADAAHQALYDSEDAAARALLVPFLVECGRLGPESLAALVEKCDEGAIVSAAAGALAWIAPTATGALLVSRARYATPSPHAGALFSAAVALGCLGAIEDVRDLVGGDGSCEPALIGTLAASGGPADAHLLLDRAQALPEEAVACVLGAAFLGSDAILSRSAELAALVAPDILAVARTLVAGPYGSSTPPLHRRWLRGVPWTIADSVGAMADPSEPIWVHDLRALEAVIRTGRRPSGVHDCSAPAARRATAAERWWTDFASEPLPPGRWHLGGVALPDPVPRAPSHDEDQATDGG